LSASTPEGRVKEKVKVILNAVGAYYTMPQTGGYGNSGTPDFIVCLKGEFIGIECKAGDNAPTTLQLWNLSQIRRAGGRAMVVNENNVAELRKELESV
jgi:hypothetical protein